MASASERDNSEQPGASPGGRAPVNIREILALVLCARSKSQEEVLVATEGILALLQQGWPSDRDCNALGAALVESGRDVVALLVDTLPRRAQAILSSIILMEDASFFNVAAHALPGVNQSGLLQLAKSTPDSFLGGDLDSHMQTVFQVGKTISSPSEWKSCAIVAIDEALSRHETELARALCGYATSLVPKFQIDSEATLQLDRVHRSRISDYKSLGIFSPFEDGHFQTASIRKAALIASTEAMATAATTAAKDSSRKRRLVPDTFGYFFKLHFRWSF